jgi:hypothetical protein
MSSIDDRKVKLTIRQFLRGGDTLIKVVHEKGNFVEYNVFKAELREFLNVRRLKLPSTIEDAIFHEEGFEKRYRQLMCPNCKKRAVKVHGKALYCQCDERDQTKRYERVLIDHMAIYKRDSKTDDWHQVASLGIDVKRRSKRKLNEVIYDDQDEPLIKIIAPIEALSQDILESKYEKQEGSHVQLDLSLKDQFFQSLDHRMNGVIEDLKDNVLEMLLHDLLERNSLTRILILAPDIYLCNKFTPECSPRAQCYTFRDAAQAMYRCPQILETEEAFTTVIDVYDDQFISCNWKESFDLIVVSKAQYLGNTSYRLLKRILASNSKAILWLLGTEGNKKMPSVAGAKFLWFAQEIFNLPNCRMLKGCDQSVTKLCDQTDVDKLLMTFSSEVNLPPSEPILCDEAHVRMIGVMVPIAYRFAKSPMSFLRSFKLYRSDIWDTSGTYQIANKFKHLQSQTGLLQLDNAELAFMYLCYFVQKEIERSGEAIEFLKRYHGVDWLSPMMRVVCPIFQQLGLHDQEKQVRKAHLKGNIDGLTQEGMVVELKYCKQILPIHKLQALLYLCMMQDDHNSCLIYNYRSGEKIMLTCENKDALFNCAVRSRLASDEEEFITKCLTQH